MKITYELIMRLTAQVTNAKYMDLVFTGSRRYEFGRGRFIDAVLDPEDKRDIDIVFPVVNAGDQLGSIVSFDSSEEIITKRYRHTKDTEYVGSSISGYVGILGHCVNLIGRPVEDVENWKFATRIVSKQLWEHCPRLRYNRDYRVSVFKELRQARFNK